MCRVNKGGFSTPFTGLIEKKKKKEEYAKCGDQRRKKTQERQLTEHTSPEQKVKVVSKYQH